MPQTTCGLFRHRIADTTAPMMPTSVTTAPPTLKHVTHRAVCCAWNRTDYAVWRPDDATLRVRDSRTGKSQKPQQLRQAGESRVAGDYDGDGRTGFAVWRPSGTLPRLEWDGRPSVQRGADDDRSRTRTW
jgi:hypothetical protein